MPRGRSVYLKNSPQSQCRKKCESTKTADKSANQCYHFRKLLGTMFQQFHGKANMYSEQQNSSQPQIGNNPNDYH